MSENGSKMKGRKSPREISDAVVTILFNIIVLPL